LISILSQIDIGKGDTPEGVFYYTPGPVTSEDPFPKSIMGTTVTAWKPDDADMVRLHAEAWQEFLRDVQQIPDTSIASFIDTMLAVLEKHTSRVASAAYLSTPDICLYDHSRSVAAIAVCMQEAGPNTDEPFLMIQGDVSGIQQFIYKLASPDEPGGTKRTAKRLRGRSFYIGLLTDTVVTLYLKRIGLHRTNLIFNGGGHFLILAPNTEANRERCASLETEINQWLYDSLHGDLGLVVATMSIGREEIKDFAGVLNRSGYGLRCEKQRKFRSILGAELFQPVGYDQKMDVCPICQSDFVKSRGTFCPVCESHVNMGKWVVEAGWLIQIMGQDVTGERVIADFGPLGIFWALPRDESEVSNLLSSLDPEAAEQVAVYRLNDTDFLPRNLVKLSEDRQLPVSFGFQFLGNFAPRDAEGPKEFEELARVGTEHYPLLGIVRMDVDSLGYVFGQGLGDRKSLSRLSTLSREMDLFFLGHLNHLAKRHDIYITYSGGDDLFAVGSWTKVLDFAGDVRGAFRDFCCTNPNLSLSAGILLCKESFPIGRAAERSAELERSAKEAFPEVKDTVSVFGKTVRWGRYLELMDYAQNLLAFSRRDLPAEERIPRTLIHHLIEMDRQSYTPDGKLSMRAFVHNLTRLRYLIARHGVTRKKIDENDRLAEPNQRIKTVARLVTDPELMRDIRIPASYVLYTTRGTD